MSRRFRIAIADDNDRLRALVAATVRALPDFELVGEAADGDATMRLVEREAPDLLLLDIEMPGPDGLQVLERLRAVGNTLRVVIYTASAAEDVAERALALGAAHVLGKDAGPAEVVATLRQAVA